MEITNSAQGSTQGGAVEADDKSAHSRLIWIISGLYLVQGLPIGVTFLAYPTLLRSAGVPLSLIALMPLAGLPWVLKFIWAPYVENHWNSRLGRRKSWIIPMQIILTLCLLAMAFIPLTTQNAVTLMSLAALASLVSSIQDIATDGLASERLHGQAIGQINTLQVAGFMVGMLIGGSGFMLGINIVGQTATLLILSGLVLACGLPVLLWREPEPSIHNENRRASLRGFFTRPFAMRMVTLGVLSTGGGSVLFALVRLILIDKGWSLADVSILTGAVQSLMVILGCGAAILLLSLLHRWSTLLVGFAAVLLSSMLWLFLTNSSGELSTVFVWIATCTAGIAIGITTVGSYTLLMRYSQIGDQPGTDFSMFQSTQTLGEMLTASIATGIGAQFGYHAGFFLPVVISLVGVATIFWVHRSTKHLKLDIRVRAS